VIVFFPPMPPHVPYGLRGLHSRLWLKCNYVVPMRWMVIYEYEVPGGALNLNSTKLPDRGRHGDLPLQGKIAMAEPGIEPGTS
jgi:hypothetical protein